MAEIYGYKTHLVSAGDSIQRIALSYNIEDWREIVHFNKLDYPYIGSDDEVYEGNVARIGDTILIPSYDYVVSPIVSDVSLPTMEELAYGIDLDLYSETNTFGIHSFDIKGELSGNSDLDLKLVTGIENLAQQLTTKLATPKGLLWLHPEWGCNLKKYIGRKGSLENLTKMRLMAQEAILEDSRVSAIENLTLTKTTNKITITCDIYPISPYPKFSYTGEILE
jgi:phage baseplate assembly protein W